MRQAKRDTYHAEPEKKKQAQRDSYHAEPEKMRQVKRDSYHTEPEKKKLAQRDSYRAEPEKNKLAQRDSYRAEPEKKKQAQRDSYHAEPERKKQAVLNRYRSNPALKIAAVLARYKKHRRQHKLAMRMHYKQSQLHRLLSAQKAYYAPSGSKKAATVPSHAKMTVKASACSYSLHQPKQHTRELYVKVMKQAVLQMPSVRRELTCTFKDSKKCASGQLTRSELTIAVLNIAVRMVVSKALRERKAAVGEFLAAVRKVNNLHWSNDDFGDCCHAASSERYFYGQSYAVCATRNTPIPVKENGTCLVAAERRAVMKSQTNNRPSASALPSANFP